MLPGGDADGTQHFRFIRLTVTDKAPELAAAARFQAAVLQVFGKACLVNGRGRGQAHGGIGHLPEFRHGTRVRVGAQPATGLQLAAKVTQLLLTQASFDKSPGIDTRGSMGLGQHQVTTVFLRASTEKMLEADFQHGRCGSIGGDMPAYAGTFILSAQYHCHGVPAHNVLDLFFQRDITRISGLLGNRYGIDIGRVERCLAEHSTAVQHMVLQSAQYIQNTGFPVFAPNAVQRVYPLLPIAGQIIYQRWLNVSLHPFLPLVGRLIVGYKRCTGRLRSLCKQGCASNRKDIQYSMLNVPCGVPAGPCYFRRNAVSKVYESGTQ